MARLKRDARLETREARGRLKVAHEPYWRSIHPGLFIGYRKGKRGATWWVRKLDGKTYIKQRLGIADDHADADGIEVLDYKQAHKAALAFGEAEHVRARRRDPTVGDVMHDYLAAHRARSSSPKETERAVGAHILPAFADRPVSRLTTAELRRWHESLANSPPRKRGKPDEAADLNDPEVRRRRKSTANRVLTILKAGLNHAWREGLPVDPEVWRRVKPFDKVEAAKVRYLDHAEAQRLLNACDPAFRALVRGALYTGARYGELGRLQVKDYHADSGTLYVAESKSGKPRYIPLTDEGRAFFSQQVAGKNGKDRIFTRENGEPWCKSHQHKPMRAACESAKITPPIGFHDLRHTYASMLAMRGVPLQVIAEALGHADTRMTSKHYAHLAHSYVADTIRAHLPDFGQEDTNVEPIGGRHR